MGLPDAIHGFKTMTIERYADGVEQLGWEPFRCRMRQRSYYERIVRNEESLNRVRHYILDNPLCWSFDRENPATTAPEPEDVWAH